MPYKLVVRKSEKNNLSSIRYEQNNVYLYAKYENTALDLEKKWLRFCLKKLNPERAYILCNDEFRQFIQDFLEKENIKYEIEATAEPKTLAENIKIYEETYKENGWDVFFQKVMRNCTIEEIDNLIQRDSKKYDIFPCIRLVFNPMLLTKLSNLKCVIIGQDPYHVKGAAMGLCFSHPKDFPKTQPSMRNILKELNNDSYEGISTDLTKWAREGVFLINTALTVKKGLANSHSKYWGYFTDQLLTYICQNCEHLVIIAWGEHAKKHSQNFDTKKHKIISSSHPSPFSAERGFFGSKPFTRTNEYLKNWGMDEIDWNLE